MKQQTEAIKQDSQQPTNKFDNDYFSLDNGLKVVLQQDFSTQKIAVNLQYHVGSAMEKIGLKGITHLIEHLQIEKMQNLFCHEYDKYISDLYYFNGAFTCQDRMVFHNEIPRDALELSLWLESNRMGFIKDAITRYDLDRAIEIVAIEKQDIYDNKLYDKSTLIIFDQIFPIGHPYHVPTIGSINDLKTLTLEELKQFYATYIVPNNATLTLIGDFDIPLATKLIQKYFAEIERGTDLPKPVVQNIELSSIKKLLWEAPNIIRPRITYVFPTFENSNEESNAFVLFVNYFFFYSNKPIFQVLKQKNLATYCEINQKYMERAGFLQYEIRALEGVDLNEIAAVMDEYIAKFEEEGVNENDLNDLKENYLSDYKKRFGGMKDLADELSYSTEFRGKPDAYIDVMRKQSTVSKEDIMNVYKKYIMGKPYLVLSVVPEGKSELAVKDSIPVDIKAEKAEERTFVVTNEGNNEVTNLKTESSFDRNIVPDFLPNAPVLEIPTGWTIKLKNGIRLFGITKENLPNIEVNITIKGGMLFDPPRKTGVSYFNSELMVEGTQLKSRAQLLNAISRLDAEIKVSSKINFTQVCIKSSVQNFSDLMLLVEEIILQPRFDEESFERIKNRNKSSIRADLNLQKRLSFLISHKLLLGTDSPFAYFPYMSNGASIENIKSIHIDDIKSFNSNFRNPHLTDITIVGSLDQTACEQTFNSLVEKWTGDEIEVPKPLIQSNTQKNRIYFVDFPNSTHSIIKLSKITDPYTTDEGIRREMVNDSLCHLLSKRILYQKGFSNQVLSYFNKEGLFNLFCGYTAVPSSVTKEALEIFIDTIDNYADVFNEKILEKTKSNYLRERLFAFETPKDYMKMLNKIAMEGLPLDYFKQQEEIIRNLTLQEAKAIIVRNINPTELIYLVVGDAKTLLEPLNGLGMGEVILLDKEGREI